MNLSKKKNKFKVLNLMKLKIIKLLKQMYINIIFFKKINNINFI